jgi:type IV pilus assembly protein PilO
MKLEDFQQIDFKNTGGLPMPVKAVLLAALLVLLIAAGYYLVWSESLDDLAAARTKETQLRDLFLEKKKQAINLDSYKQQMVDIEKTFGVLLKQLPDKSQMDGLLTDINQAGLERGLDFELFKPGQETFNGFYAELPISIKVTGSFYDLGGFATDISKLSRIVTLNDISIVSNTGKDGKEQPGLEIEATAKTYRYLDASEISSIKDAKKGVKK